MKKKLYVFYIGGDAPNSLIELHDVRFAIGEKYEDTYDQIRDSWWGIPESLHLDCWAELKSADGHNIVLSEEKPNQQNALWFVNLGGYDPQEFTELHHNAFIVAPTASKAKVKALKTILDWKGHHKDGVFEVEKIFNVNDMAQKYGLYLHFIPSENPVPFTFTYGYKPIGRTASGVAITQRT